MTKRKPLAFHEETGIPLCDECWGHFQDQSYGLIAACASVGIERKRSTTDMLCSYLSSYHERRHRERVRA